MNILFPEQSVLTGAAFNRLYLPMLCLADMDKRTQIFCVKADAKDKLSEESFNNLFWGADLIMTYFPGNPEENFEALNNLDEYNEARIEGGRPPLAYVVDVDDWFLSCSPFNLSYIFTGTEEKEFTFKDDDGTEHIKGWFEVEEQDVNGKIVRYDTARNKKLIDAKIKYIKHAHAVTCTTEALAVKLRTLNPNVYVLPNGLDLPLYEVLPRVGNEVRIGYAYSASHLIDWLDIAPALRDFVNKTPFVKLVLMGDKPSLHGFELGKVEYHPFKNILNGYHKEFSRLRLDIGLAPLFDDDFNSCKSPLKWMEYSACGTATLASQNLYGDYIKQGDTGMLYRGKEEFAEALKALVKHKELREHIAETARKHIAENYDIRVIAPKYYEVFEKIISKEEVLVK